MLQNKHKSKTLLHSRWHIFQAFKVLDSNKCLCNSFALWSNIVAHYVTECSSFSAWRRISQTCVKLLMFCRFCIFVFNLLNTKPVISALIKKSVLVSFGPKTELCLEKRKLQLKADRMPELTLVQNTGKIYYLNPGWRLAVLNQVQVLSFFLRNSSNVPLSICCLCLFDWLPFYLAA